eukprot:s482_g7.t2
MCKRHAEQAGGSLLYASSKRADAMGEAEIHVWKNTAPRVVLKAVTFQSNTASTRVRVEIAGRTSSFASLPRDRGSAKLHNTGAAPPVNVWLSESKGMSVSTKTDSSLSKDAGEAIMLRMHETIQKAGADRGTPRGRVPGQMKLGSALLLYSCLAWTQAEEPESRFGLVISTLEDRSTLQSLPGSIEGLSSGSVKAKENSEKAFVQLREFTASISALETGIASLEGDVKELQDTQDQMSNIREEEASKYNEEVDLNAESARTVDKALSKIGAKSSFLQRQSLEPDSGYVMGLLRGIKEKLNQTRSELDQTEEAKRKTHSSLFKAKKDQLSLLQAEVLEKTRLLQQAKVQLVEAQRIHDEEQESGKEMIRMQAETREKCDAKDGEYKLRQDDKKKEREAIVEAVSLLKQEEAGGENAAGATFFLQMSSKHRMSEDRKDSIRDAVALMQQQTADKAQGMGKAAEAVLQLVEAIRGHQAEDTKRKQFCEFQLDGSQDTKAKLQGEVARLKARQEYLSSEVTSLTSEVEGLKKDAAKFTDRLSQLEEVRSKEQDSYKASSRDRGLTLKVVKKAKSIVEGFYKSKDLTAFSQEDASPPKMTWKLGSSRNGNLGSSVIAMLDTIMEDFQKEQKDADAAEEKAEEELAKVRSETKSLFDKKLEHVSKLLQEKARDAEELTQVKADAELKTSSLAATEDALVKLGKDCTKLMADYEKVAKERRKQILQLQDVADILSGATVGARTGLKASGTLAPAPHNPTMRALLERYTQSHTLTERDEDGEHPLFPQSRSRRAEQRPGHAGGAELVLAKESMAASSREQILISRVLHKIDTEKLTHVKEVFMEKENALTSKDFVDLLLPTVRSMEGGEEQVVAALQLVHETIGQGVKGEEEKEVKEVEEEDDLMNPAFMTEAQVEEETQKLLSWEVFAKLLLQEGVVANVVAGFNLTQVLSVIDLEKITPLQAIFEKKGNVDLESFVVIMKGQFQQVFELIALFELYEEERKIISQLVNLFDAIDVDCNGSMTWEEFTAFLVDQGMAEDVPQQYNIIRFSQSPLKDGNGHQSHCEKVIYLKGYDKVAFVEQGSRCLKLCSPDMKPYFEIRDFTQTPLCAEYIEKSVQIRTSQATQTNRIVLGVILGFKMSPGAWRRAKHQAAVAAGLAWLLHVDLTLNFSSLGVQRRHLGLLSVMTGLLPQESRAEEPFNPLKLKGYFWETGKFYEGQTSEISESNITKILEELRQTEQPWESLVSEGKFEDLKTQLRGANFSESLLRIRGKRVLKLLSQQESTVEDDEKFQEAEQGYVLLGQELNGLNAAIDSATVDFSRGAFQLVDLAWNLVATLRSVRKRLGKFIELADRARDPYNWVAVSCSDKYLSFFDVDNSLKLVRRVQSKTAQRVLCWSEAAEVLFSADHEGRILSWSLHKVKFGPFDDKTGEEKKEPTWRDFMKDAIFKRDPPMRHISVEAPREASMSSRRKGKGKKDAWGRNDDDLGMWDSDEYGDSPMHQISQELQGMDSRKKTKAKVKPRYRGENIVMQLLELPVLQQIASCGVDGNAFASLFGSSLGGSPSVMDELDRSKVEETFEVLALEVPARRTGEFLKRLAAHLLNLARRKNVEPAATSASKLILMSRSISDIGHLPTEREWLQEQITSGAVKLSTFQVTLSYEHFTAEEVLRKLLPKGMEIPSSFEQAGHIAHLNLRDSQLPYKHLIGQVILDKNKSVKTVVNKTGKIETEFRTFPMEHLAGEESTVVRLKEHQCLFEFEYQDVYWNSRLQEEHGRLIEALFLQPSRVAAETAPVVADCTCGVGPFSIPSVKLSNSLVSHANDLNPASIQWLRKSVEINKLPQVMEVDDVPPHGEDFHPPGVGSLLVIHKPRDAREFIPELFNKRHPVTHAIFNLPAAGVELLDCFRGLNYAKHGLPRPLVSCYTFSDAALDCAEDNGCVADLQRRIAKALALPEERFHYTGSSRGRLPLPSPDVRKMVDEAFSSNVPSHQVALTVRLVRNVAPTRHMFCVCFRAPLVQEEEADEAVMPSEKRPKLCEKDLLQLGVMTWDVFTGMWKRTLRGHEMGVRCMAFATSTKVLVTGGYDYNLFVWNPYVGKSIHTIHGHSAPIVGIEVLGASSNQVVSADSEGFVKTWDLGTYQMIQSFVVDEITILRAFVSIPSSKRVIAVDREFVAFDYQNTGIADQTEEEPLIKVFYNERLKVFVSGTINVVKIWDAVTGAIKVVITHKDAEITDFCFDDRGRKLFVSDHLGKIHVYHSSTGCLVKKLTSHNKEVSGMIYCQGDKNIITVSWDRSIVVHDESSKTEVVHRRATNSHKGDITCVAYSRHLGLIATGSTDCVIAVREYLKLRILSYLLGHKTDVTALAFVEPYPLLVSADFGGNVAVWAVPTITGKDHRFANKVLTRFINMQSLESSASVNCLDPICPINDDEHTFVLYTGDEDGEVRSWDLSALLPAAGVQKCPPIPASEWDPYKRVENDASHTAETVARKASSMEVPELQAQMEQPLVRQGFSWKAHSDSLRTLKVYRNPPCVVTAGFDGMAKIWTWEGKLVTVLRAYGQSTWDFPVEATDPCVPLETQNWLLEKVHEASDEKPVDAKESLTNGYQKGIQTARS